MTALKAMVDSWKRWVYITRCTIWHCHCDGNMSFWAPICFSAWEHCALLFETNLLLATVTGCRQHTSDGPFGFVVPHHFPCTKTYTTYRAELCNNHLISNSKDGAYCLSSLIRLYLSFLVVCCVSCWYDQFACFACVGFFPLGLQCQVLVVLILLINWIAQIKIIYIYYNYRQGCHMDLGPKCVATT